MDPKEVRIVFMGTPEFAVESLKELVENNYNVVGVITVPDKPAGRGRELQESPVKKYAIEKNIRILQPEKLKSEGFISQLKEINPELQVVVAFRMLPELVWKLPRLGTINLHASLLPNYRGAAPINWAIINGEKETGITTFFIQQEIDTGNILFAEKISIEEDDNAGSVHDKLMVLGSKLVVKTIDSIALQTFKQIPQNQLDIKDVKLAPKIFKENCKINWNSDINAIYNFIRGLSPYPAAWTELQNLHSGNCLLLKIFETQKEQALHSHEAGKVISDGKNDLKIAVKEGFIQLKTLQLEGKKRLHADEFLRGFKIENHIIKF